MGMRAIVAILACSTTLLGSHAHAQRMPDELAPFSWTSSERWIRCPAWQRTVVEVRGDTLLFKGAGGGIILVPAASLTRLEVRRGTHSHLFTGAVTGLLIGAVVGGAIGYSLTSDESEYSGVGVVLGAPVGLVGAVVGAVVGSRQTERWERLRLPVSVGLLPGTGTIGLSARFAVK